MNKQLLKWASEGYAPTLLYDDNGHWAVSFSGMSSLEAPEIQHFFTDGIELQWRDTPREAVDAAVGMEHDL